MLEQYLKQRRQTRDILLMTHIVAGHPSFETSLRLVEAMVTAGVDLIELQIPFSEPSADGPVILRANQEALAAGSTVERCFELAGQVARRFDVPFLFMTYYNILFKHGVARFAARMAELGLRGAIVPDLPPEEGDEYLAAMNEQALAPIFIYSPNTPPARLATIAEHARGFVYCVARKGVTGSATAFSSELSEYLARARAATSLPLAVGFGVKDKTDVAFLRGKADIAVVGSETLRVLERGGISAVTPFLESLR
ncbi:MAG TPA: tryptophan synthase subunit alpha [Polyangiaceae bacterium]